MNKAHSKMCSNPYYKSRQDSDWNWNNQRNFNLHLLFKYITAVYFRNYSKYFISQKDCREGQNNMCGFDLLHSSKYKKEQILVLLKKTKEKKKHSLNLVNH